MASVEAASAGRRDIRLALVVLAPFVLLLTACGSPSYTPTLEAASTCEAPHFACPPNEWVNETASDFGGPGRKMYTRRILVKWHKGGKLEWVPLYVVSRPDGETALIDPTGKRYDGGLDDFRRHNELFSEDDKILAPADLAGRDGKTGLVSVSGHTGRPWWHWPALGIAVAAVAAVAWVLLARLRRDPFDADPQPPASEEPGHGSGDRQEPSTG